MQYLRSALRVTVAAGLVACALAALPSSADEARYRKPPKAIEDVLNAPQLPVGFPSPDRAFILLARPLRYPPIADLAKPMLRLAGMRIDPSNNGIHHASSYDAYTLVRVSDGQKIVVSLRPGSHASAPVWSSSGSQFAFANATDTSIDLYLGSTASGAVRKIPGVRLNDVFRNAVRWTPDGKRLLVYEVPVSRGPAPREGAAPSGPVVQETTGKKAPAVTFEDLLQTPYDENVWEHYVSGMVATVDPASGTILPLTPLGVYPEAAVAPDGKHVLLRRIVRPYSYAVPYENFGHEVLVTTIDVARKPRVVATVPLQTNAGGDAVPAGPRAVRWRADKPAVLVWTESKDAAGDAAGRAGESLKMLDVEKDGAPATIMSLAGRFRGLTLVAKSSLAIVRDYNRETRFTHTQLVDLDAGTPLVADLGTLRDGDRYHDPGTPVTDSSAGGQTALRDGDAIFLRGDGYGPDGRRPFLDRLDLKTRQTTRLFQSELTPLENVAALLDARGDSLLVVRQSPTEPPNYTVRTRASGSERDLTKFVDPAPILRSVQRRIVAYKRPDGLDLSFVLYLPPGYKEGTRLPTFVWAYPAEFNDPSVAGQNTNSTQTFTTVNGASEIFMALAGYAVLDNAAVPIVGDSKTVNDTFVEQLTADMKAAVDKAAALGVTDPDRVAVGGHSYGAFMTANLLAHTRMFRAGIARSGAYNRSLTPFGFQNERRTYWDAPDLYTKLSPFTYADKIADPLLMIHGMADDNTGTFPIQSERMYAAVRGNGGTARLVFLPDEAHGYLARESIETTLAEMVDWLDRYVKPAKAASR
ncbi:MAG: prolyl oligopeptidase family serine peptidase [Candidatus Eremiobacteraeota bacterium]|nr:prolyl oligopeptidase family serine peptidase [Candidatus Eremiobacteraeota bacterium]